MQCNKDKKGSRNNLEQLITIPSCSSILRQLGLSKLEFQRIHTHNTHTYVCKYVSTTWIQNTKEEIIIDHLQTSIPFHPSTPPPLSSLFPYSLDAAAGLT